VPRPILFAFRPETAGSDQVVRHLLLWFFVLYKEGIKTIVRVSLTLGWLAGLLFIAEHCREQFILVPTLLSTPIIVTGGLKTAIAENFAASSLPWRKTPAPLAALHWRLGMNRRLRNGT